MNVFKRLHALSVSDLHRLQSAILDEIDRRKVIAIDGAAEPSLGADGHDEAEIPAPRSTPLPLPRRAA